MKTKRSPIYVLILILVLSSMACAVTDYFSKDYEVFTVKDTGPDPIIEPTPTATPIEVSVIEPEPANQGQIAYAQDGNLWLYYVDTEQTTQLTQDGIPNDYQSSYMDPILSPDGFYLAYVKHNTSYIQNLESNEITNLGPYGWFLRWMGTQNEFVVYQGDYDCPTGGDLSEQQLMNFDLIRMDINDLDNPEFLTNVSGGLSYPQTMSGDGQWTSVLRCGCQSECGGTDLINLYSNNIVPPPIDLPNAAIDFSPDSFQLVASIWQMYGYSQSPLYVANSDYTNMNPVFSEPNTTPGYTLWSPDGDLIASTIINFCPDTFVLTDSRVVIMHPDGTNLMEVDGNYAELMGWSPGNTQLIYLNGDPESKVASIYNVQTGETTPLPFIPDYNFYGNIDWGVLP